MASPRATRLIAHLDMDAFYASVELLRRPDLRGQAVVIGGRRSSQPGEHGRPRLKDYTGRGVVTTATYEARAFGIHSGMGLMRAASLMPEAILLPADFDAYRSMSRRFKAAVAALAPAIEDRGIDEIYIDLSDVHGARDAVGHDPLGGARALALDLKNSVREATGLSCSIGLAPNKLLAKICSDLDKPDGLTVVMAEDVPLRIWPLPVRRINGIGPKAGAKLDALGVHTIGQLAAQAPDWLIEHFGAQHGAWMHAAANGQDDRPVVTESEPVSMSRETTFEHDLHPRNDRARLGEIFTDLCQRVAADLQRKGYVGRTIGIKLRFDDFRTVTRDQTLAVPTDDAALIRATAGQCLKRINLSRRLRLLGVRVGTLNRLDARSEATLPAPAAGAGAGAGASPVAPIPPRLAAARPVGAATGSPAARSKPAPADSRTLSLFDLPEGGSVDGMVPGSIPAGATGFGPAGDVAVGVASAGPPDEVESVGVRPTG